VTADRVVTPVEGMHRAISGRWFGALGRFGAPVRVLHDALATTVYGAIRVGAAIVGNTLEARQAVPSRGAESVQAWVNGLWGDGLGRHEDRLAIAMSIRDRDGGEVGPAGDLVGAFPGAAGRIVVMVHGLVETERVWWDQGGEPGLARRIEQHPDLTAVAVRYNTGLRVSDNGARLAALLEHACAGWPVPVRSIALVGHSMGGLVVRSACHAAATAGHGWIDRVSDVVTIGTPHRGAPLEKLTNVAAWALSIAPETRPLAELLNGRSGGIKDLRFGGLIESDWAGADPDALLRNTVGDHRLPAGIDHHFVAGVVTDDPRHPLSIAVGDLWVRPSSGTGAPHLAPTNVMTIGGVHHFDLLREPAVIDQVLQWLVARA
jgi:hypothetical protein